MSELSNQAEALKKLKSKYSQKEQPQVKSKDKHSCANKEAVSEIYNRKDYVLSDIKDKDIVKTQIPPQDLKNTNGGFGGFKKGFLSGSKPKPRLVKTDRGSASVSSTVQKSKSTLEDIPLRKKDHAETDELKLLEVQEKKKVASDDLMKNQNVPLFEDMSEQQYQAEALNELKPKYSQKEQPQVKSKDKHSSANKEAVSEIYKRKDYGWLDIKDKDTAKTQTPPKVPKNTNGGFGGFKKGFLSGSKPKSKPVKTDKGSASVSSTEQKSKSTLEDIPLIKKEDHAETEELKLPEVQEKKKEASDDLMKNQKWVIDDLLSVLENNEAVKKGFQDPEYKKIIGEFQTDPQGAMEKYKDHEDFQKFFREFCELMGNHFANTGSDESTGTISNGATSEPTITTVPMIEGAQMSLFSSTNPNQPMTEDEQKMQQIVLDSELQMLVKDPKIAISDSQK